MSYAAYRINQLESQLSDHKKRQEVIELIVSYARDIVKSWDTVSFRTLRSLHDKVMGLKEALELLK